MCLHFEKLLLYKVLHLHCSYKLEDVSSSLTRSRKKMLNTLKSNALLTLTNIIILAIVYMFTS